MTQADAALSPRRATTLEVIPPFVTTNAGRMRIARTMSARTFAIFRPRASASPDPSLTTVRLV
jgi:hypothetical protein